MTYIETERLHLRQWEDKDLPFFIAMNQDPLVMEFFLKTLTSEESEMLMKRLQSHIKKIIFFFVG